MAEHIEMPDVERKEIAESLSRLLADTYALYLKTQNYHWNVVGPRFRELHLMFEQEYEELAGAVDEIAERIRIVGFSAPATFAEFSRLTSLQEEEGVPNAETMVHKLRGGHESVLRTAREVVDIAGRAGDHGTVELATERIAVHEKTGWMLASAA